MSTELAVPEVVDAVEVQPVGNLFGTDNPAEVVTRAKATADALMEVVRAKNLIQRIKGHDHPKVEAWTLLGSMLGVFPVVEWTRQVEGGWEARVEAKTLAGAVVGAAEAQCLRAEENWKNSDDYAIRSMAQTRAVSKALRGPLGFIVQLGGLNPTPAEEMPRGGFQNSDDDPSDPVFTFGKNKGKKVSETPVEYRKWIVENFTPTDEHGALILDAVKDSLIPF